ncbi:MAG: hypothetical protein WAN36_10340, partial [Calditrichia bacterium]
MGSDIGFKNEPLQDMVSIGRVDSDAARIWVRVQQSGRLQILWNEKNNSGNPYEDFLEIPENNRRDNTGSIRIPGEKGNAPPLKSMTEYEVQVRHTGDGHLVGKGRFETAPQSPAETPERFSLAVMSCNQPFGEDGSQRPNADHMLQAAKICLERHKCKFVLMVGDQMYSDYPQG